MNYRHVFHAGNFADVHKHVALVCILQRLQRKETPFAVIDTHAGRGLYDLSTAEAARTGEAADGIGKLAAHSAETPALAKYLSVVRTFGPETYSGSPAIAARLLRPQDRLVAIESEAGEFHELASVLARRPNVRCMHADGYTSLSRLLPPPERRGVVFMDPPYEDADEMQQVAAAIGAAHRRFATGAYAIWYPLKSEVPAQALAGELESAGIRRLLSLIMDIGSGKHDAPGRLGASGLLVVNPPYGLDAEMRDAQAELLPLLKRGGGAKSDIQWLIGEP
ncbi:MAG: 23S rRNA (adenine(2030)-N(6))-methyltransferase RlmJ [Alphaproteobacteria bacterium]|nr:23S rRNA (adenine(2030)-N(6))-methyltransferase RlmJ [Alphaproteobacteria bacterium]